MKTNDLKELSIKNPIILDNITCVYCGCELIAESNTKEHVIGRRFVPKGSLNQQWNLFVRACKECNSTKSDLEDDISAITMQKNAWGEHVDENKVLSDEALRKGKNSYSNLTGKPVESSHERIQIHSEFSEGITLEFGFTAPPQIEDSRIFSLARMQIMAFFYYLTFNKDIKKGGFWREGFYAVFQTQKLDWGNDILISFMNAVVKWEPRWLGYGASGYFKCAIRRHPSAECWSWALEWNKNYRIIGFFGDREAAYSLIDTFPTITPETISKGKDHHLLYHSEKQLHEKDDVLFSWGDEC